MQTRVFTQSKSDGPDVTQLSRNPVSVKQTGTQYIGRLKPLLLVGLNNAIMYSRVICVSQSSINGAGNNSFQTLQQACVQIDLLCLAGEKPYVLQKMLHTSHHQSQDVILMAA